MTNDQLKAWRARLSLGEAGMAAYLGTPVTTYRKWENGTRQPDSSTRRLFDVLQLVETRMPDMHAELVAAAVAMGGPEKVRKPRKAKAAPEPLCEDQGCPHSAVQHVCISAQPAAAALPAWMTGGV